MDPIAKRRRYLLVAIIILIITVGLYVQQNRTNFSPQRQMTRGATLAQRKRGMSSSRFISTQKGQQWANKFQEHYLLCDAQSDAPLKVVFGMLAGPKYIRTRIRYSLLSYLRHETSVVYLENEEDEGVQGRVKRYLTDSPDMKGVDFKVAFLKKTEEDIRNKTQTGAWKNVPILRDLWLRFGRLPTDGSSAHPKAPADWFVTVDDDTYVLPHNMYLHLSTFYTTMERRRKCRGWKEYKAAMDAAAENPMPYSWTSNPTLSPTRALKAISAQSKTIALGWNESAPIFLGKALYFDESHEEGKSDPVYYAIDLYLIHGGGGIFTNRAAVQQIVGNDEAFASCTGRCRQPGAGDVRISCCAKVQAVPVVGDEHFTVFSMLRAVIDPSLTQRKGYPISFHANRRNHTLPLEFNKMANKMVDVTRSCPSDRITAYQLASKTSQAIAAGEGNKKNAPVSKPQDTIGSPHFVSKRCTLKAMRGIESPSPIFWDSLLQGFHTPPLVDRYPPPKHHEWGANTLGNGTKIELNDHDEFEDGPIVEN